MKTKICVGAILYNDENKIFLMTSPKWKGWLIPGGRIEGGESEIEALRREIREELEIEITDIIKVGESIKSPSEDFKDPELTFHFFSYIAKILHKELVPNEEISEWGWFTIEEALKLDLLDSTRNLIESNESSLREIFKDQTS